MLTHAGERFSTPSAAEPASSWLSGENANGAVAVSFSLIAWRKSSESHSNAGLEAPTSHLPSGDTDKPETYCLSDSYTTSGCSPYDDQRWITQRPFGQAW